MNEIKIFENTQFGQIRVIERDGEPWFVGKEVAEILGYSNTRDALVTHVDNEDKNTVAIHDGIPGNPNQVIINESGLYSLVLQALSQDDQCSYVRTLAACERLLAPFEYQRLIEAIQAAKARLAKRTAWRIEGTLREFAPFAPVNVWFEYPVHTGDRAGVLGDAQPESEKPWYERGKEKRRKKIEHQKNGYLIDIQNALDMSGADAIAIDDLTLTDAKGKRINPKTIKGWLGNGNQAQDDFKKAYEKFMGEDGRAWLRRRNDTDTDE